MSGDEYIIKRSKEILAEEPQEESVLYVGLLANSIVRDPKTSSELRDEASRVVAEVLQRCLSKSLV